MSLGHGHPLALSPAAHRTGAAGQTGSETNRLPRAAPRWRRIAAMLPAAALVLAACTGRVEPAQLLTTVTGFASPSSSSTLSGVVSLKDSSSGAEVSAHTDAVGSFAIDVSGLTPPFVLRIDVSDGATTARLHAISAGAVNINPVTDAVVVGAADGLDPDVLFAQGGPAQMKLALERAATVSTELATVLAPLYRLYGVTDPVDDTSPAGTTALRAMLRDVSIGVDTTRQVLVRNRATGGVIYHGPSNTPSSGTFVAANLPASPSPAPPACTYTYSSWGACQPGGTQSRTVLTATPDGCAGTPVITQSCSYVAPAPAPTPTPTPAPTPPATLGALGAFPGCQGSGCETRGGMAASAACAGTPTVYRVTSLADGTGPGTLGACIAARGPRVCVFGVAGTIATRGWALDNPCITIDGRTAPGGGVEIVLDPSGWGLAEHALLWNRTNNVVIRGLRMRPGQMGYALLSYQANASSDVHHVVLDHDSFSFGDKMVCLYGGNSGGGGVPAQSPRQLTLSWNVVAEPLTNDGYERGALLGAGNNTYAQYTTDFDIHHNYWADNWQRNPLMQVRNARLVNNVIFNWGKYAMNMQGSGDFDFVANLGRYASMTSASPGRELVVVEYGSCDDCYTGKPTPSIYLSGNKLYGAAAPASPWDPSMVRGDGPGAPADVSASSGIRASSPQAAGTTGPAIHVDDPDSLVASVVAPTPTAANPGAGASYRLDCGGRVVPNRDAADVRVAQTQWATPPSYSWSSPTTVAFYGGQPAVAAISADPGSSCPAGARDNSSCACADSDGDGIPDYWETAFCGSATGCDPFGTDVAAPWTNLEAFLSGQFVAP